MQNTYVVFLLVLNALVAIAGSALGALAAARPSVFVDDRGAGAHHYARMYAAKALPFGLLAALVPFLARGTGAGLCLLAAGASQALDAAIGLRRGDARQTAAAATAALIHCAVAVAVW